jgi:hypothetical protein
MVYWQGSDEHTEGLAGHSLGRDVFERRKAELQEHTQSCKKKSPR